MSNVYNRVWSLSVGGEVVIDATTGQQFKATFTVLVDYATSNSYAEISVMNLSKATAGKIFKSGSTIELKAGYVDTIDTIFIGRINNVLKGREGATTSTRLICRSQTTPTFINQSFGVDVSLVDLIKACSNAIGYPAVINEDDFADIAPYSGGYSLQGDPRQILDKLAITHGFKHVVENGRRVVLRDGYPRNTQVFKISQTTGMEGVPQITEVGANVRLRMTPKIHVGGQVEIESELAEFEFSNLYFQNVPDSAGKGVYRVLRITHEGDTKGDTWSTELECTR